MKNLFPIKYGNASSYHSITDRYVLSATRGVFWSIRDKLGDCVWAAYSSSILSVEQALGHFTFAHLDI